MQTSTYRATPILSAPDRRSLPAVNETAAERDRLKASNAELMVALDRVWIELMEAQFQINQLRSVLPDDPGFEVSAAILRASNGAARITQALQLASGVLTRHGV